MNNYENLAVEDKDLLLLEKDFQIFKLQNEVAQFRRMIFGAKSERFLSPENPSQLKLEIATEEIKPVEEQKTIVGSHTRSNKKNKNHQGRHPFPESLPREVTTIYPEGFDETTTEQPIGIEVTEILEEIPGKFYVKRIERPKYKNAEGKIVSVSFLPG